MTEDTLQAKIRVLEEENALLAERAEDLLLLGSVAEEIEQQGTPDAILQTVLERVCILKDLPLGACCVISPAGEGETLAVYTLLQHEPVRLRLKVAPAWPASPANGRVQVHAIPDSDDLAIQVEGIAAFFPRWLAAVPFGNLWQARGAFVFLSDSPEGGARLQLLAPLIERIIAMTLHRLERETLIQQLRSLNETLEQRVAERTAEIQQQAERLRTLHQMDIAILAASSPEQVAMIALVHLRTMLACQRISIVTFDFERRVVHLLVVWNANETATIGNTQVDWETYQPAEAVLAGDVWMVPDVTQAAAPPAVQALRQQGLQAYFNIPLSVNEEVIGALNVGFRTAHAFNAQHVQIAREVAAPLAIAIHQTRLRQQVQAYTVSLEARIRERTAELQRLVNLMAGREVRMAQLKEVIQQLQEQLLAAGLTPVVDDPLGMPPD